MMRKHWLILSRMVLAFGIQSAFAGEAWLAITSEPPGAAIAVDNAYRGMTPQHPGDVLRIRVPEGARKIEASAQIDGQDYTAQQTVKARSARETAVKLQLRAAPVPVPAVPAASTPHTGKPWWSEWGLLPGNVEVPGRNF